jgi:release factor glutamine methyltransferase
MGTGSGAIAVAMAHSRPDADVTALDVSPRRWPSRAATPPPTAPACASCAATGSAPSAARRFDLIASNPPYIAAGDATCRRATCASSRAAP